MAIIPPLGTSSPEILLKNAINLDFAVNNITQAMWGDRFGRPRKTWYGMEAEFLARLASQESRFNAFIERSGYQVIGDYEDGPLTITEYNQLIRYQNELWKLTADTGIRFTTSGHTDESWNLSDKAHFVSVGDGALRQDLSPSGLIQLNVAQAIAERRVALSSNTVRFCTWNIQTYYVVSNENNPGGPDSVDTSRFDKDYSSVQLIREHIEWLLRIGADVIGLNEVNTSRECVREGGGYGDMLYNWEMGAYADSYFAPTLLRDTHSLGNPVGNGLVSTRALSNSSIYQFDTSTDPQYNSTYVSVARSEINVNGTVVAVYATHLSVDQTTLISQIQQLCEILSTDKTSHIVVMGDMNWNDDAVYKPIICQGFTMVNKNGELNTYNGGNTEEWGVWYLDRIFHKGFSSQGEYGVATPPRELGDHKPLWCDLTI